jgi:hypothetical protein
MENSVWVLLSRNLDPDEVSHFYELGNPQRSPSSKEKNMSKHSSAFKIGLK